MGECTAGVRARGDYPFCATVSAYGLGGPSISLRFTVPCGTEIALFAHETEECYFVEWFATYGGDLPVGFGSFENPWYLGIDRDIGIDAYFRHYPLVITAQPQGAAIYEGMNYTLHVGAEGGVGTPHYDWNKDGVSIDAPDAPSLEITAATVSIAGEYWCTVSSWQLPSLPIPIPDFTVDSDHVTLEVYPRAVSGHHAADMDRDWQISLPELLRVIQFYNMGALHCQDGSEDGYAPGAGDTSCAAHHADYLPQDWQISLPEVLRIVQFFNALGGAYHAEPGTEDGFAPQAG